MSPVGFVQDRHPVEITTPLGPNVLLVEALEGDESLSSIYEFHLHLVSEDPAIAFDDIVGKNVCVSITKPSGDKRFVHGIVGRFRQGRTNLRITTYFADLYPKLWLLSKATDTRIFQNKTVPDIIKQVLSGHEITDLRDALAGTYQPREYCVQYQETDLDFISRLMESEGIFYRFEHTQDAHTLVLADDASSYGTGPDRLIMAATDTSSARSEVLPECSLEVQMTSGGYKLDDYNFETPATDLLGVASGDAPALGIYEYPAGETSQAAVETVANRRLTEMELPRRLLRGTTNNPDLRPGHTFKLGDHPRSDANDSYVAWKVRHEASQESYSNAFDAFPAATVFRPPRTTPSPRIYGCQTALVVGKAGEEITTDQYGRVKVKFHWDQATAADETSSTWLRVVQGWAGKQWGAFFLPRIGQEVVVSFLDGDPDHPIVTGCVYNAQQTVPYALPDNQTRSGVKSDSSKGSGGFNEIRFEDKKDSEELFVQAQKDMLVSVLHDQSITVKNARTVTIQEADDTLKVEKGNRTLEVAGKESYKVTGERTFTVTGKETRKNDAAVTWTFADDLSLKVGGKLTVAVTGDLTLQVSGNIKIESAQNTAVKAGTNLTTEGGVGITSKAGATHTVEGGAMLVLKGAVVKIN